MTAFLLSGALKVSLLMVVALAVTALLRRRSAALRHWVLASTLAGGLLIPLLETVMPSWPVPIPEAWRTSTPQSTLRLVNDPGTTAATRGAASNVDTSRAAGRPSSTTLLLTAWLTGLCAGVALLAIGILRIRQLASGARPLDSGRWREAADETARSYGLRCRVRLLLSDHPTMLVTWGTRHPSVLLPACTEEWSGERMRAVLRHELAHVYRGDWMVTLVGHALRAIYWFNPLVWLVCRQLRHESERACDDLVLSSGISGADYATHLLEVARETSRVRHATTPAIAIAHPSTLEGRVRAMLNARINRRPVTALARLATLAFVAVASVPVAVVTLSGEAPAPVRAVDPARPDAAGPPTASRATAPAAQASGGTIEGVLYDPYGGLLPGVSVKLTTVATGAAQISVTDRGGSFAFRNLPPGDYDVVTDLPGFTAVTNTIRAESGSAVRRHITLPLGSLTETIHVTCSPSLATARPNAPTGAATPGAATPRPVTQGTWRIEPPTPSTFTGGIGGQIRVPTKLVHVSPVCPAGVPARPAVVRLGGRVAIDGLLTDLRDLSAEPQAAFSASALEAARQWKFTPTLLNGAPIEANITITVDYRWE